VDRSTSSLRGANDALASEVGLPNTKGIETAARISGDIRREKEVGDLIARNDKSLKDKAAVEGYRKHAEDYLSKMSTFSNPAASADRSAAFWNDVRPDSGMGTKTTVADGKGGEKLRDLKDFAAEIKDRESIDRAAQQNLNVDRQRESMAKRNMRAIRRQIRNNRPVDQDMIDKVTTALGESNMALGGSNNVDQRRSAYRKRVRSGINPHER
jgi:hypothetical protein